MNFKYQGSPKTMLPILKTYLENEKFNIQHYAPEDGYILTDYKKYHLNRGNVELALSIHVHGLVVIRGMGKIEITTAGLGDPDEITGIKSVDELPYSVQKAVFLPIGSDLDSLGLKRVKKRR
ncbi:MAG TPA: hypothetical protein EYO45_02705 [Candidatus Marinimicrobia bacterium]|nr:hypothetical protein [Candidatus Neomarinimicrobiota bacterium]